MGLFGIKMPKLPTLGEAAPILGAGAGFLLGGPAGAYFGGQMGLNYSAQDQANRTNINMAREQMAFQERMSNTAHQREMADLEAAGLNPTLSAGGNGSSTPGGAAATVTAPQINFPEILSLKNLALEQQKVDIASQNSAAEIAKKTSDTDLIKMKKILAQKGMMRAELEGEAAQVMNNMIRFFKNKWKQNQPPKIDPMQFQPNQSLNPN